MRRLNELKAAASNISPKYSDMPRNPNVGRKVEDYAIQIAEQEELISLKTKQCIIERNRLYRYIVTIEDSLTRMIMQYRYINGLSWLQVAMSIGGGNTADSVRMTHNRYLENS